MTRDNLVTLRTGRKADTPAGIINPAGVLLCHAAVTAIIPRAAKPKTA